MLKVAPEPKSAPKSKGTEKPQAVITSMGDDNAKGVIVSKGANKSKVAHKPKLTRKCEPRSEPDDKWESETCADSMPESEYKPGHESEDDNLVNITVKGLRDFARENGVSFSRTDNRAKMIDNVRAWKKAHNS